MLQSQDQSSHAFNVNELSQYLEDPKEMQQQVCERILRNLDETSSYGFFFFFNTPGRKLNIETFADANRGADKDYKLSMGVIYLLRN